MSHPSYIYYPVRQFYLASISRFDCCVTLPKLGQSFYVDDNIQVSIKVVPKCVHLRKYVLEYQGDKYTPAK